MDAFQRNQSAMRDALGTNMLADLAKKNMEMFQGASRVFSPPKPRAGKSGDSDVDKLRAELAELQAKVDRLNR